MATRGGGAETGTGAKRVVEAAGVLPRVVAPGTAEFVEEEEREREEKRREEKRRVEGMATRGGGAETGTGAKRVVEAAGVLPRVVAPGTAEFVGRHRLTAAITRLNQEIKNLQDELNELETMEPASAACKEVSLSTEGKPDALLPITPGPENAAWERWFQRVRSSQGHKWWIHRGSSDVS